MQEMKLTELKTKSPTELLSFAEEVEVENASTMRKQELMFAILKQLAAKEVDITGIGVVEVLQDGFGFLRSPDANYLPGPDDIYVSPSQIRRFSLRTGDTVEGQIRSPKDGERYFALLKVNKINFDEPEQMRHKVHFDNGLDLADSPVLPHHRGAHRLDGRVGVLRARRRRPLRHPPDRDHARRPAVHFTARQRLHPPCLAWPRRTEPVVGDGHLVRLCALRFSVGLGLGPHPKTRSTGEEWY